MRGKESPFQNPKPLEYPEHFRPGMGTEVVAPFLRSMVQLLRPHRVLEIGAGYTTPFLLEGLVNNQQVFDDGNLDKQYFQSYVYEPRLVIIDDMSLGELREKPGMDAIINSPYVEFVEGFFQGKSKQIKKQYGDFDFVWFDCGGNQEYKDFLEEYWSMCCGYIFFHFTYSEGTPNSNMHAIMAKAANEPFKIDIVEPHKTRQGSVTIVKKQLV